MKTYFKVHPGPTFDILEEHLSKHRAANKAALEWAQKHNLPITSIRGTSVSFKNDYTPDKKLWNKSKKEGYTPRLKNPEGGKLADEMKSLPAFPSWFELIDSFSRGRELEITMVNQTGTPGIVKNKSEDFYRLSIDTYWLPEDRTGLEEVTASEFHAEPVSVPA